MNKRNKLPGIFLIIIFCILCVGNSAKAAYLKLQDFSGQAGPAPPPAPFATTTLWINNAPNNVDQFKIRINYDPNVFSAWQVRPNNDLFGDWEWTQVGHVSGHSGYYYYLDFWTVGTPISTGTTVNLAEITFTVDQNEVSKVTLSNLEYDIEGWSTKDAIFTPVPIPTTMFLLVSGLIGLARFRKKFKR